MLSAHRERLLSAWVCFSALQVVLADNIEENQHAFGGVSFVKLGPFSLDGTFLAYRPGSRAVEPCKI